MKRSLLLWGLCALCLFGFYGCSDDDGPDGGKGAVYQLTLRQFGELTGFIKSLVVTANGAKLVHQESGQSYDGTAALGDEELTGQTVTLATDGKAIEFAVSGGAVDRDNEVVSAPVIWTVTVTKDGKEVGSKTLTFEDGQELTGDELKLYFK